MQLWTDYEGVTIDGAFPLQKLLLPEGRSAFFSTAGPNGEPTVVRLIECHFDEQEILARWHSIEALNHPNFLKFERYGQTELDGGPVVYAVFEKVDANLAAVLSQGHLSVKDVTELASSLVTALDMLHTHGFVHEHIEPRNIFAVGDVVKLRSDCIREAPEAAEGRAAKQRDVHDLAIVLLQALTQRQSIQGIPDHAIPPPFGQIVRNGLDGVWGLEDIKTALEGLLGSTPLTASKSSNGASAIPSVPIQKDIAQKVPRIAEQAPTSANMSAGRPDAQLPLPLDNENQKEKEPKFVGATTHNGTWGEKERFSLRTRWLAAVGVVAFLLLFFLSLFAHIWNSHRHNAAQAAAVSQTTAQPAKQFQTGPAHQPLAASSPSATSSPSASSRANWRVIPFTYNRKTDAEKKAASLAISHPELQPAVFSPSGHAPYLVSIGGVMDRDTAYTLAHRARSLGLPHDTYAQNYSH